MPSGKNEIIVDGEPDKKIYVHLLKGAAEETAKVYGPIFPKMVIRYALDFEAKKLKEEPPENIQGLDDLANYLIQNLDKYPNGHCAIIYGIVKAESKLQGATGAASRGSAFSAIKGILDHSGVLNSVIGTTEDPFEAVDKFGEISKKVKTAYPERFIRAGEDRIIKILDERCPFRDACTAYVKEGITRIIGGVGCASMATHVAVVEIITKKKFDYKLEKSSEHECRGIIFRVL